MFDLVEETKRYLVGCSLVEESAMVFKKGYLGQCDKIRSKFDDGEAFWQHVMKTKKKITEKQFLSKVDPTAILDEDETWDQWRDVLFGESESPYFAKAEYKGSIIFFVATGGANGFEFFWSI